MPETLSAEVGRAFYGTFRGLHQAQQDAIGPILRGHDVIVLAKTGSGKTEAVVAPLVQRFLPTARQAPGASILYVTPTRALVNDLLRRLDGPMERLGLLAGIRHGEHNDLARARKPDLLITTPESFDVLLMNNREALSGIFAVVIDEVHLTYNTQRGFQVAVLLRRLEQAVGRPIQVVGLSATVASPGDIWSFFRPGRPFEMVRDSDSKPMDCQIREIASPDDLIGLLNRVGKRRKVKILLFANSRRECDGLGATLRGQTVFGERVFVHHSSLDRHIRLETERNFLDASSAVCIATSTLELGIDIGDIDLVMLYGHPGGWDSFLQRVGRGNRRFEKTNAVCLVTSNHGSAFQTVLGFVALLSQIREGRFEGKRPLDIYGTAAQQLLSVMAAGGGAFTRLAELTQLFADWPYLDRPTIDQLLDGLATAQYVTRHDFQYRYGAGEELHRLRDLRLIWGNFPARSREIKLVMSGRQLGAIPANNLLRLRPGVVIRFAGRHWRVRRVRPDSVELEPSRESGGLEVTYEGPGVPLDPTIVEQMLRLLEAGVPTDDMAPETCSWFAPAARLIQQHVSWDRIPVGRGGVLNHYYYFTFAGRLVNSVIAKWAGLSSYDADDIVLKSDAPIRFSRLPDDPSALQGFAVQSLQVPVDLTIFQSILPIRLLEQELADIWAKTPVFARSLARLRSARIATVPMEDLAALSNEVSAG